MTFLLKCWTYFDKFCMLLDKFSLLKMGTYWPNNLDNLAIWSHWSLLCSKPISVSKREREREREREGRKQIGFGRRSNENECWNKNCCEAEKKIKFIQKPNERTCWRSNFFHNKTPTASNYNLGRRRIRRIYDLGLKREGYLSLYWGPNFVVTKNDSQDRLKTLRLFRWSTFLPRSTLREYLTVDCISGSLMLSCLLVT